VWTNSSIRGGSSRLDAGTPAVAHGRVYVPANGYVVALDAFTGSQLWIYRSEEDMCALVVFDDVVFAGSDGGKVYALNATTGNEIWVYSTLWENPINLVSALAVANGKVYVTCCAEAYWTSVWILNATDGSFINYRKLGDSFLMSIAVAYGMVFVGGDIRFWVFDAETLSDKWNWLVNEPFVYAAFLPLTSQVYVTSSYKYTLYCFDIDGGEPLWTFPLIKEDGHHLTCSPAVADEKVFLGDHSGIFYAINAITGSLVWSYNTGDSIVSSPAVAYGTVFVASGNKLYAFSDPSTPPREPVHDIAVRYWNPAMNGRRKTVLCQGWAMSIHVSIDNHGDFSEGPIEVTLFVNASVTETKIVEKLPFLERVYLTFVWNSTGFEKSRYSVEVYAELVPEESNVEDNMFVYGNVDVSMEGDITGDLRRPDGKVDIYDIALVCRHYGETPGYWTWEPNCDIDDNRKVDIVDVAIVASHFGEIDP